MRRFEQGQPLIDRVRDLVVLELDEKSGEHGAWPCGQDLCRDMKIRRSKRCTSCSFFNSAPCSGGIMGLRSFALRASGGIASASSSFSQSSRSEVEGLFFI